MNIVVVLKQTPDTESLIRIAPGNRTIVTEGLKWIINPYDEFAVEAALRLKTKNGGKVTVVSYGPPRVLEALRTALAMGADEAVLLDDPALKTADYLSVTTAITAAVKTLNPDIILLGSRAIDYDQGQRGPIIAEKLGWPHLGLAVSLDVSDGIVTVDRPIEGGKVTLESSLPVLVTLGGSHAIWNPRYASLPGIMKAKKKPVTKMTVADMGLDASEFQPEARVTITHLEKPAERKTGRIIDEGLDLEGKARELARVLHEEAKAI